MKKKVRMNWLFRKKKCEEHFAAVMSAIRDLTALAKNGQLDEIFGRDDVMDVVLGVVARRIKGNVLLVGEAGVGKTAIVEGIAHRLLSDEAPASLKGRPVYEVRLSELLAGTRYRGDMEERIKLLIQVAIDHSAILFIDEFHTIMGAGASSGGSMDVANIFKPCLARGEVKVIGATTFAEAREIKKDKAMMRRFQPVVVSEPTAEKTREIIDSAVGDFVIHHGVGIEDDMLDAIIDLADRYLSHKNFPDKAFDMVDLTCVIAAKSNKDVANIDDVREALSWLGGRKLGKQPKEVLAKINGLAPKLSQMIFGQERAIDQLSKASKVSFMGLQSGGTKACYLFNGASSVGKTTLARCFAESLELPIFELSMFECGDRASISKLIGAAPGLVGYEDEGVLVEAGEGNPEFVVLLKGIEKAHPDVLDLVKDVVSNGLFRAGDGRMVSMSGAHIIMTADLGNEGKESVQMGFSVPNKKEDIKEQIIAVLGSDFYSQINSVVQFDCLDDKALELIADAEIKKVQRSLKDTGIDMKVSKDVAGHVARGVCKQWHAGRLISDQVKSMIVEQIAQECAKYGAIDAVSVLIGNNDEIVFEII